MTSEPPAIEKAAAASRVYAADFRQYAEYREDETLSDPVLAVSPSGPALSAGTVSGSRVLFRIAGGTAGEEYTITVTVTTSGGSTLVHPVTLKVT